jgi:hypothetical protein
VKIRHQASVFSWAILISTTNGRSVRRIGARGLAGFDGGDRNPTGYAQVLEDSSTLNGTPDRMYSYGFDLLSQNRKVSGA